MKSPRHDARTAEPSRTAAAVHAAGPQGEAADALQASPHLVAQREAIQSAFGPAAQRQNNASTSDNRTGMPDALKSGIESLSGMDLSDVRVRRNSGLPEQLQAHAVAQGNEIHLAPGQQAHLPHEAWHVVQQRQGRVKPTTTVRGAPINDDESLEREADLRGAQALQRKPEALQASPRQVAQREGPFAPIGRDAPRALSSPGVVQRMPTRQQAEQLLGGPSGVAAADRRYHATLRRLDGLNAALGQPLAADAGAVRRQLQRLLPLFDKVINACAQALSEQADPASARARALLELKLQTQNEKSACIGPMMAAVRDRGHYVGAPALSMIIQPSGSLHMDETRHLGVVGGGMSVLDRYSAPGVGRDRFFKPNMASMDVFASEDEGNRANPANDIHPGPALDALMPAFFAKENRSDFADKGGISATDTRSSAREVASHRLDQLLGGGVTAHAQFALRTQAGVTTLGSVQREAHGAKAGDMPATRDAADQQAVPGNPFRVNDSNLLRQLSRLQLLDTLALQMDRHGGNFFLDMSGGNVNHVTGIDNDMSFGTRTDVELRSKQYSGMSRYVDQELAQRIVQLDPKLIRAAMSDLLNKAELDALVVRLAKLKSHLAGHIHLLPPAADWSAFSDVITNEKRGYQYTQAQRAGNAARGY